MTNILKNLKILLNKHFSLLLIIILILNLSYNLFFRYNYLIPYGWDEIITIWPVGNELLKANLDNWPNILFSRFLSEDHLFPVTNFFAYFICKLNGSIIENLYWISRLCYIIILALSITLVKNIGFTKANIFYFIIIFLNAGPINFSILSYNLNFNLVCIFSLLSTIFYLKAQEKEFKNYNTQLFLVFSLLGTFTSENFYILYPLILYIFFSQQKNIYKIRGLFVIAAFLFIIILKFWVSFHYLGILMPNSRLQLSEKGILLNALSVIFKLFNDILFGLPLYFIESKKIWVLITMIFLFITIINGLFRNLQKKELKLFFLILVVIPFIGYTGRFHPGMWTFVELIGIAIITLIFSKVFFKNNSRTSYFFLFVGLFSINYLIDPYSKLKTFYNESFDSSNMAYGLIQKNNEKLLLYNLSDAKAPMHPIAFWIGSKIYQKKQGLTFKQDEGSMHMYDIDIESIKIDIDDTFSNIYIPPKKNITTLVKTNNSIINIKNFNGLYSEYSIFDDYKKNYSQEYDIFNPSYNTTLSDTFTVKIYTNKYIIGPQFIKLKKSKIFNLKQNKKIIQFDFVSSSFNEKLILNDFKFDINKIVVSCINKQFDTNSRNILHVISDKNSFFKLFNSQTEIYGSLEKFKNHNIESFNIEKPFLINIQFWYYNVNAKKWDSFSENNVRVDSNSILSFKDNKIFTTKLYN